jgi:DNA-binding protein H-NS
MKKIDLNSMSTDELWQLHEKVALQLAQKIPAERAKLNERLRKIEVVDKQKLQRPRRPYPPVHPKYQNPQNPAETWSGRGKLPRWLKPQLRGGRKKLDDFLIGRIKDRKHRRHKIGG